MYKVLSNLIPVHSRIVIYGGGKVGNDFLDQLIDDNNYTVIAIIDKNPSIKPSYKLPVYHIEKVKDLQYDYIIIAIDSILITTKVHNDLVYYGVDPRKIIYPAISFFEERVHECMRINGKLLLSNLGGRLDKRLLRLEILQYYSIIDNYNKLDSEQREALRQVQEYQETEFLVFPEDKLYKKDVTIPKEYTEENVLFDKWGYYSLISGHKLYFGRDKEEAMDMLKGFYCHYESDNPHRYLCPKDDGIDIVEGDIIADIGACEGYFGIKYYDICKKVYFFEGENEWIIQLNKSLEKKDKAVIVKGYVGDEDNHIRLDDYYLSHEKPSVIKIDVEGMELAVLRGAEGLLNDDGRLLLLIATYHRQDDWNRIEAFLNPDPKKPRFHISHSNGYYWHIPDPKPPYFRRGIMRAERIINERADCL